MKATDSPQRRPAEKARDLMRRRRHPTQRNSGGSASATPQTFLVSFHAPSLGDKLQVLAEISPRHLRAVELVVDEMIRKIRNGDLE